MNIIKVNNRFFNSPGNRVSEADALEFRIKPLAGLLVVGVGLRTYTSSTRDQRIAEVQAADRYDAERRRQNELMDQYGARDSLEELEKAVAMYEKRQ